MKYYLIQTLANGSHHLSLWPDLKSAAEYAEKKAELDFTLVQVDDMGFQIGKIFFPAEKTGPNGEPF